MSNRPRRDAAGTHRMAKILPITSVIRLTRVAEVRKRIASGWYDRAEVRDRLVSAVLHEVRSR